MGNRLNILISCLFVVLTACGTPSSPIDTGVSQTKRADVQAPGESVSSIIPGVLEIGIRLINLILDIAPILLERRPELFLNTSLPFPTCLGNDAQLAVFDANLQDILVYPGAGRGIRFAGEVSPGHFLIVRDFKAWIYDIESEKVCLLSTDIPGFVFWALPDAFSNVYVLVADTPLQALLGIGKLYRLPAAYPGAIPALIDGIASVSFALANASPSGALSEVIGQLDTPILDRIRSRLASPSSRLQEHLDALGNPIFQIPDLPDCVWPPLLGAEELCKINVLGAAHGGIQLFYLTTRGDKLVFTTGDGGLYLYFTDAPGIVKLDTGGRRAANCTIDGILGRYVAWEDPDTKEIFVLDLLTGCIDPVLFLNRFLDCQDVLVALPFFYRVDPFHLYIYVILLDGTTRIFSYDLQSEKILSLTLINAFLADSPCGLSTTSLVPGQ